MDAILKFQGLLEKLFQFDASDLDFGIYRILNFKRNQIGKFIREDLRDTVEKVFAVHKDERLDNIGFQLEDAKQKVIQTLGVAAILATGELKDDFKGTPVGREYLTIKAQKEEAETIDEIKLQVFNDLYNFFARYYEEGDFVPQYRYSIKNHKYAIPYNGEEVKLYWANCDQYYTKTGILFRDYAFFSDTGKTFKVIFRTVVAKEEVGSNKATKARFFVLDDDNPWEIKDGKCLIIRLQYRELNSGEVKKYGVEGGSNTSRQEKINSKIHESAIEGVKDTNLKASLGGPYKNDKPLLLYQLGRFSAKNTKDYFIHKNLKRFLSEQLDYFIKAEVISLETLEKERFFDKHITRAKVVREIGEKIIDFLAQIEDFQKKLWEKKKFVLKTEYVITTDRVPEELYPEILKNKAQAKEWKELGFEVAKSKADLKDRKLPIDTKYFPQEFKESLLESLTESENLDDLLDGLLIKSENWQALNLIVERYKEKVKCIYIDPPYNTNASEILYKNNYKHSSWLSLMHGRMLLGKYFLCSSGLQCTTVDDMEFHRLRENINSVFGDENIVGVVAIKSNPSGRSTVKGFSIAHEYAIFSSSTGIADIGMIPRTEHQIAQYKEKDSFGYFQWRNFMRSGGANDFRTARPKLHYPVVARCGEIVIPKTQWSKRTMRWELLEKIDLDDEIILPVSNGIEYTWRLGMESLKKRIDEVRLRTLSDGKKIVEIKFRIDEEGVLPKTVWDDKQVNATAYGTTVLRNLMGVSQAFSFPKSVYAVQRCIQVCGTDENDWVLDYFAGSGTTAHAVINLNREDGGNRKYILVEMASYFETVLMPRIKKVVFTDDWKDGKPQSLNGISHFMKYQYLEQYEDALDNLELIPNKTAPKLFGDDYLLKYFLDFETKDNPSLLNMEHLKKPFSYKLKVNLEEVGEPQEVVVDIPETFNYLLGLKVNKVKVWKNKGKKYLFTLGEKENRTIAVVWREYDDEWTQADFKKDKEFIMEELGSWSPQIVYVNGQSVLTPAFGDHVVEIRSIEQEFKTLMVNSL
ncbi:MAG: site-specific DNA-methyltransferase [Deltaproteobacteria bacterium]|nr:site-specific DNA-methyltransferase [Deltaproteobacteria bacterium]